jgi:hypothetical protein
MGSSCSMISIHHHLKDASQVIKSVEAVVAVLPLPIAPAIVAALELTKTIVDAAV